MIHENGIKPDIKVKLSKEELQKLVERQMKVNGSKTLDPAADPQLARALEALESYHVFSGSTRGGK